MSRRVHPVGGCAGNLHRTRSERRRGGRRERERVSDRGNGRSKNCESWSGELASHQMSEREVNRCSGESFCAHIPGRKGLTGAGGPGARCGSACVTRSGMAGWGDAGHMRPYARAPRPLRRSAARRGRRGRSRTPQSNSAPPTHSFRQVVPWARSAPVGVDPVCLFATTGDAPPTLGGVV